MRALVRAYYEAGGVALYLGDCRELLPELAAKCGRFAACITDPPYAETSLAWDSRADGWISALDVAAAPIGLRSAVEAEAAASTRTSPKES